MHGGLDGWAVRSQMDKTKVDRMQAGKRKMLRCPSDCPGKVVYDDSGGFDAARMCPAHLLLEAQRLEAERLCVSIDALTDCPLYGDYANVAELPANVEIVADKDSTSSYVPSLSFRWFGAPNT